MTTVVPISANPRFRAGRREVTRAELQRIIGYQKSKIFEFQNEGMPRRFDARRNRNLYDPVACIEWLRATGRTVSVPIGHNNPRSGGHTHA